MTRPSGDWVEEFDSSLLTINYIIVHQNEGYNIFFEILVITKVIPGKGVHICWWDLGSLLVNVLLYFGLVILDKSQQRSFQASSCFIELDFVRRCQMLTNSQIVELIS
jgi:hypothetical protein